MNGESCSSPDITRTKRQRERETLEQKEDTLKTANKDIWSKWTERNERVEWGDWLALAAWRGGHDVHMKSGFHVSDENSDVKWVPLGLHSDI